MQPWNGDMLPGDVDKRPYSFDGQLMEGRSTSLLGYISRPPYRSAERCKPAMHRWKDQRHRSWEELLAHALGNDYSSVLRRVKHGKDLRNVRVCRYTHLQPYAYSFDVEIPHRDSR